MNNQGGFSLVELMISLFLSSLLMAALVQHYSTIKQQFNDSQKRLEESFELQLVSELIRDSARSAGFTPCLSINHLITRDTRDKPTKLTAIELNHGSNHSLQLSRMSEDFLTVQRILGSTSLSLKGHQNFNKNEQILIADCFHAELHVIASSRQTKEGVEIRLHKPLVFNYVPPIYLGEWLEEQFIIKKNPNDNPALYYELTHSEEITELIIGLIPQLIEKNENTLLYITLELNRGKQLLLETKIRTP